MKKKEPNIALVHDFLLYPGGAEKVLVDLSRMFPKAPIYTILCDKKSLPKIDNAFGGDLSRREIRTSFLQKCPRFLRKRYRWLVPFFASAVESFDLRDFDIVISSSGAWSKGVVTRTYTQHIAYIHSPMRFVWDYNERYWKERGERPGLLKRMIMSYIRVWDAQAAERPDTLLANSLYTQKRIKKYYRRESTLVYPGVFSGEKGSLIKRQSSKKYFLLISRLSAVKRIDLAVDVCNKLGLPLVIIGEGPERKKLEKMAGKNIRFVGWLPQEKLDFYYNKARAFLFPCQDDFGIAPVEAMLRGIPVIAVPGTSASEIIEDGKTGILCDAPTSDGMADGLRRFFEKEEYFSSKECKKKAQAFSREVFEEKIQKEISLVEKKYA